MRKLLLTLLVLSACCFARAAGTCVISNVSTTQIASQSTRLADPGVVIVTLTCTADASAHTFPATTVPLSSPGVGLLNSYNLTGFVLYEVGRTPGTTEPTANYTTTITDADGFALDLGLLTTNGSASAAQLTPISSASAPYPVFPTVRSALTVQISANSVDSAQITLDLIFKARI
jgi:hypothetical protein